MRISRARTRRSHLQLCNLVQWCLSETTFRPSNGLPEPTGSVSIALKSRQQRTSSPPSGRSAEYSLCPVPSYCTFYSTYPLQKQWTHPWHLSSQVSYDSSFLTATVYRSEAFSGSLLYTNDSPTTAPILLIYVVASSATIPFEKLFHGSYSLCTFLL